MLVNVAWPELPSMERARLAEVIVKLLEAGMVTSKLVSVAVAEVATEPATMVRLTAGEVKAMVVSAL